MPLKIRYRIKPKIPEMSTNFCEYAMIVIPISFLPRFGLQIWEREIVWSVVFKWCWFWVRSKDEVSWTNWDCNFWPRAVHEPNQHQVARHANKARRPETSQPLEKSSFSTNFFTHTKDAVFIIGFGYTSSQSSSHAHAMRERRKVRLLALQFNFGK